MNSSKLTASERTAFWTQHVEHWRQSGLSQTAYSKQADIAAHQLGYWINKGKRKSETKQKAKFIAVTAQPNTDSSSAGEFILTLPSGEKLQWCGKADTAYVAQLIKGLAQ